MNSKNMPLRTLEKVLPVAVLVAVAGTVLLVGCGDKKGKHGASQTAAKVNKEEITVHQINFVLQQQRGVRPEQTDAVSRQILDRLIDQELAVQKAEEMKIDRDPQVVQQLEAAKREVISRAYLERVAEGATKPTPEEIKKYYDDKPALFKDRKIYSIQELSVEAKPEQVEGLKSKLDASKNINEFVEYLKANDFKFAANQAVRAAEQVPLQSLDALARMSDGQSVLTPVPGGARVVVLAGSRSQPVALEQAKPAIEQFLLNERKRDLVNSNLKQLHDGAKIEYVGKFAGTAAAPADASASGTPSASVPSRSASGAGLDASSISKGMGLK